MTFRYMTCGFCSQDFSSACNKRIAQVKTDTLTAAGTNKDHTDTHKSNHASSVSPYARAPHAQAMASHNEVRSTVREVALEAFAAEGEALMGELYEQGKISKTPTVLSPRLALHAYTLRPPFAHLGAYPRIYVYTHAGEGIHGLRL